MKAWVEHYTRLLNVEFELPSNELTLNLNKGEGEALDHGNYHGLKLTDQVMKLLEWVLDSSIPQMVNIDEMQFAFVPGRSTTEAIFIVCQLQEKCTTAANKQLYFAFVDFEKAFDCVPRKVLLWALRNLGVDKWAVRVIQGMYHNARSRVQVNGQYSEEFGMGVGVHQGSVLSPLLFLHPGAGSAVTQVQHWCAMGASLCWWPGAHRKHPEGVYLQAQGMEGWHGK